MGGLIGAGSRLLSRGGAVLASSPARAGAAGAAGGIILDDVPVLSNFDPTEGANDGLSLQLILLIVLLVAVYLEFGRTSA